VVVDRLSHVTKPSDESAWEDNSRLNVCFARNNRVTPSRTAGRTTGKIMRRTAWGRCDVSSALYTPILTLVDQCASLASYFLTPRSYQLHSPPTCETIPIVDGLDF
jgi:hypothetical protein